MAPEQPSPESLRDPEVLADLKATVGTHRELGSELEDYVLEAFLARIEQRVDARVVQQSGSRKLDKPKRTFWSDSPLKVMGATLALAIPLLAIAGDVAGARGVIIVMAAVLIIDTLYFIDRWIQMSHSVGLGQ